MAKRISKIAGSLKQLGDVHVNEWDFMTLLNKDIRQIELARSLRRLGDVRVMEWDFRTVLPAVNKLAHQEVDVVGFFRRTAHYKVMEWDFRAALPAEHESAPPEASLEQLQALILQLKDFLQYVAVNLIDEPGHAQIRVQELGPKVLRFRLVLVKRDVMLMIGREGHTAAAVRSLLKAAAGLHGVQVLLEIHSHEEEAALVNRDRRGVGE